MAGAVTISRGYGEPIMVMLMLIRIYSKDALLGLLAGSWMYFSQIMGNMTNDHSFNHLVKLAGGGYFLLTFYHIVLFIYQLSPFFALEIIYGLRISRHFSTTGMYYLGRCENRSRWFLGELRYLAMHCFITIVASAVSMVCLSFILDGRCEVTLTGLYLYAWYITTIYLHFLLMVLLINIGSLRIGNLAAGLMIPGLQIILALSLILIPEEKLLNPGVNVVLRINPMTHIVLSLHSSFLEEVDRCINQYGAAWNLSFSIVYFGFLIFITSFIGIRTSRKYEFL